MLTGLLLRGEYLVITELTITTLFAYVFVLRHQMSCCGLPSFPAGSLMAFWNPENPPAALLLLTNYIVQHQSNSKITRTMSWEQPGYCGFLLYAQGELCIRPRRVTLIEFTQIRWFSRWSGREGWSSRVATQRKPRVSKLRFKGPFNYHPNETAVEAARWGQRCSVSRWRPQKVDKRMVLEHTHGLFIT